MKLNKLYMLFFIVLNSQASIVNVQTSNETDLRCSLDDAFLADFDLKIFLNKHLNAADSPIFHFTSDSSIKETTRTIEIPLGCAAPAASSAAAASSFFNEISIDQLKTRLVNLKSYLYQRKQIIPNELSSYNNELEKKALLEGQNIENQKQQSDVSQALQVLESLNLDSKSALAEVSDDQLESIKNLFNLEVFSSILKVQKNFEEILDKFKGIDEKLSQEAIAQLDDFTTQANSIQNKLFSLNEDKKKVQLEIKEQQEDLKARKEKLDLYEEIVGFENDLIEARRANNLPNDEDDAAAEPRFDRLSDQILQEINSKIIKANEKIRDIEESQKDPKSFNSITQSGDFFDLSSLERAKIERDHNLDVVKDSQTIFEKHMAELSHLLNMEEAELQTFNKLNIINENYLIYYYIYAQESDDREFMINKFAINFALENKMQV